MMTKITKGTSFSGLLNYILDDKKNAEIIAIEGVSDFDKNAMIRGFELQASMNTRVEKKVGHISLNFLKEDFAKLDNQTMAQIATEYLSAMGITDTQFVVARHFDKEHSHCHIAFNRINNHGKTISDSNEHFRNFRICKDLKQKYGLTFSQGKTDVNRERLKGTQKTKYQIYDALKECVPKSNDWSDLVVNLTKHDVDLKFKTKGSTDKVEGIIFSKNGCDFSGSKIDKQFSYWNIEKGFSQKSEQELSQNLKLQDDAFSIIGASKTVWEDFSPSANLPSITFSGSTSSPGACQHVGDEDEEERKRKKKKKRQKIYYSL